MQGYIDEYRFKIEDLEDVIRSLKEENVRLLINNESIKVNNDKLSYYKNCKKCQEKEIKNRHIINCIECRKHLKYEQEVNNEIEKIKVLNLDINKW